MDPTNECRIVVGRLLEIDLQLGYRSTSDVDAVKARMTALFAQLPPGQRVVIAADWRDCQVLAPPVSEAVLEMLTRTSPQVERSALLHGWAHPTSVLQLFRLVKESAVEVRRLFTDMAELQDWLDEVLTSEERARLRTFLAKRRNSAPPP